jgi:hypothetical protein
MAGARYHASGEEALASSASTALSITAASSGPARAWIYEAYFGNEGTPADLTSSYTVERITAITSGGSAVTAGKLDEEDVAARSVTRENDGTTGTFTANEVMLEVPVNHRGTYRWVAPPGGEWVLPSAANDGFAGRSLHASVTTVFRVGMYWIE